MENNELLTLTEALQELAVSRSTMYRLIHAGKLTPIRYNKRGKYRFDRRDLERFLTESKQAETPNA